MADGQTVYKGRHDIGIYQWTLQDLLIAPGDSALDGALTWDTRRMTSILEVPPVTGGCWSCRRTCQGLRRPAQVCWSGVPAPFWLWGPGFESPVESQLGMSLQAYGIRVFPVKCDAHLESHTMCMVYTKAQDIPAKDTLSMGRGQLHRTAVCPLGSQNPAPIHYTLSISQ